MRPLQAEAAFPARSCKKARTGKAPVPAKGDCPTNRSRQRKEAGSNKKPRQTLAAKNAPANKRHRREVAKKAATVKKASCKELRAKVAAKKLLKKAAPPATKASQKTAPAKSL